MATELPTRKKVFIDPTCGTSFANPDTKRDQCLTSMSNGGGGPDLELLNSWVKYFVKQIEVGYHSGDSCDLWMRFQSGEILGVHRFIVSRFTDYFAKLERKIGLTDDGVLNLPQGISYELVVVIVKFFYTGKLALNDIKVEKVYNTIKMMNIKMEFLTTVLKETLAMKPTQCRKQKAKASKSTNRKVKDFGKVQTQRVKRAASSTSDISGHSGGSTTAAKLPKLIEMSAHNSDLENPLYENEQIGGYLAKDTEDEVVSSTIDCASLALLMNRSPGKSMAPKSGSPDTNTDYEDGEEQLIEPPSVTEDEKNKTGQAEKVNNEVVNEYAKAQSKVSKSSSTKKEVDREIDSRIMCGYCGNKYSERSRLPFHLYCKHGVLPPKYKQFHHCDQCDFVAIYRNALTMHKEKHDRDHTTKFPCTICNATFLHRGGLQDHMISNLHRNKSTNYYECPYCREPYFRVIYLKHHIRFHHEDCARKEEMVDPLLPQYVSMNNRPDPVVPVRVQNMERSFSSHVSDQPSSSEHSSLLFQHLSEYQSMESMTTVQKANDEEIRQLRRENSTSEVECLANVSGSISTSVGSELQDHREIIIIEFENHEQAVDFAKQVGMLNFGTGVNVVVPITIYEGGVTGQNLHISQVISGFLVGGLEMESICGYPNSIEIHPDGSHHMTEVCKVTQTTKRVSPDEGFVQKFLGEPTRVGVLQNEQMRRDPQGRSMIVTVDEDVVQAQVVYVDASIGSEEMQTTAENTNVESSDVFGTEVSLVQQSTFAPGTVEEVQNVTEYKSDFIDL